MCPDRCLLSAYVDGEVPSPWKERLAAHLAECPSCAALAARFGKLSGDLRRPLPFDEEAMAARVAARVAARLGPRLESGPGHRSGAVQESRPLSIREPEPQPAQERPAAGGSGLWSRRVALPLPLAVAAALVLVFSAGLAAAGFFKPGRPSVQSLAAAEIAPNRAEPASMEALIRYLESQDAQVNLTIQLPAGKTFDSGGKPLIVKASDYVPLAPAVPADPEPSAAPGGVPAEGGPAEAGQGGSE